MVITQICNSQEQVHFSHIFHLKKKKKSKCLATQLPANMLTANYLNEKEWTPTSTCATCWTVVVFALSRGSAGANLATRARPCGPKELVLPSRWKRKRLSLLSPLPVIRCPLVEIVPFPSASLQALPPRRLSRLGVLTSAGAFKSLMLHRQTQRGALLGNLAAVRDELG